MRRFLRRVGAGFLKGGGFLCAFPTAILAMVFAGSALCLAAIFFAFRIVFWLYVQEGRIYRLRKSRKSRIKAIERQGDRARRRLSNRTDRRNLNDLLRVTHKVLDNRENEIMVNTLVRTKLMLADCKTRQDFHKTFQVYRLIVDSEPGSLNQLLNRQIS